MKKITHNYICEKCNNNRFKTKIKGEAYTCRKCGHTTKEHKKEA